MYLSSVFPSYLVSRLEREVKISGSTGHRSPLPNASSIHQLSLSLSISQSLFFYFFYKKSSKNKKQKQKKQEKKKNKKKKKQQKTRQLALEALVCVFFPLLFFSFHICLYI